MSQVSYSIKSRKAICSSTLRNSLRSHSVRSKNCCKLNKNRSYSEVKTSSRCEGSTKDFGSCRMVLLKNQWLCNDNTPFDQLAKKKVKFLCTPKCQQGLEELKKRLMAYSLMHLPDWTKAFHVYCNASTIVVGSTLCYPTNDGGRDHLIAFASKQLSTAERNYTTTERECLAMIFLVKKYCHYLLLNKVVFLVDHMAIKFLVNKPKLNGQLAWWLLLLAEFYYIVYHKPW